MANPFTPTTAQTYRRFGLSCKIFYNMESRVQELW
jgi:hypothetical protein